MNDLSGLRRKWKWSMHMGEQQDIAPKKKPISSDKIDKGIRGAILSKGCGNQGSKTSLFWISVHYPHQQCTIQRPQEKVIQWLADG